MGGINAQYVDDVTVYANFYYDMEPIVANGPIHIIGVEHMINDYTAEFVHHFVLIGLSYDNETITGFTSVYGWAPGVKPWFSPGCGFESSVTSGFSSLLLNTHYDNPHKKRGFTDNSGVRIYYTREPLPHECGNMGIGQADAIENEDPAIPPGKTKYVYECLDIGKNKDGSDVDWEGNSEITVFNELLHMHEVGREQWAEIKQGDGEWIKTGNIEFWDFNFQSFQKPLIGEYKLKPGDSIRVTCIYDTPPSSSGGPTRKFGLASQDEMCLNGMIFYPRISAIEGLCSYGPDSKATRTQEKNVEFVTEFGKPPKTCPEKDIGGNSPAPSILSPAPSILDDRESSAMSIFRRNILYIFVFSVYFYCNV